MVEGEIPRVPEGVLVGLGESGVGLRGAVVGPHDPFGQEEIPEETGHQEVLTIELLKEICESASVSGCPRNASHAHSLKPCPLTHGKAVPGDGVSDGCKDPIQLSQWSAAIV